MTMEIKLPSGRIIGAHQPVFIIAEVGSNWSTLEDCMTSISQAKACGADAVKFQLYDEIALYGQQVFPYGPNVFNSGELPIEWLPKLKEKADAVGIEFMCTAFSPELLDAVNPFVNIHKMASSEMCHVRMLEQLRDYGKPVFLSAGAQHLEDIKRAVRMLDEGEVHSVVMYCPAAYPSRYCDTRLIRSFAEQFPLVGFSDHTTDVIGAPVDARARGAVAIEKHVNFVGASGPDAPHSLSAAEFGLMVKHVHGLAEFRIGPTLEEQSFITRHKRRLIATRDIQPGEWLFEGENFGIYRSLKDETHAFSPWMIDEVAGKAAKRAIKAGDGIGPGDV